MVGLLVEDLPTTCCRLDILSPLIEKASVFVPRIHGCEARILRGCWLEVLEEIGKHIATNVILNGYERTDGTTRWR